MNNYRVILMPRAEDEILEIAEYIALDNPARAVSFIADLVDALKNTLSIFPESGQIYHEHNFENEIRSFPHGNYLSFYQVVESKKTVEILYIFHSKRDIVGFIQGL